MHVIMFKGRSSDTKLKWASNESAPKLPTLFNSNKNG